MEVLLDDAGFVAGDGGEVEVVDEPDSTAAGGGGWFQDVDCVLFGGGVAGPGGVLGRQNPTGGDYVEGVVGNAGERRRSPLSPVHAPHQPILPPYAPTPRKVVHLLEPVQVFELLQSRVLHPRAVPLYSREFPAEAGAGEGVLDAVSLPGALVEDLSPSEVVDGEVGSGAGRAGDAEVPDVGGVVEVDGGGTGRVLGGGGEEEGGDGADRAGDWLERVEVGRAG